MTGYNELFLGKSIKIAINFYTKALSRNCVVIDYSFCQAARVVSEKTSQFANFPIESSFKF